MKAKKVIELVTETYSEQQFILSRFPEAYWNVTGKNRTIFYLPVSKEDLVEKTLKEWNERNG